MKALLNFLDRLPVDNKLLATVLTTAATRAVLALGIDVDPFVESVISLAVGAVVGYRTPNEGTVLRTPQESGNAKLPDELAPQEVE